MRPVVVVFGILALCLAVPAVSGSAEPPGGRYQLVPVPGQPTWLFLLDTSTGCTWQLGQNPETKRLTFVETDVENLHWTWGGGAQARIAERIDASNLPEEQKRTLKRELQQTACGWSPVVQTPSAAAQGPGGVVPAPAPPTAAPGAPKP
jgi:hypothetical protein